METTELDSLPSLPSLYARAVGASVLPGGGDELPSRRLAVSGVEIDPGHVADYCRVCGFRVGTTVPATYPHLSVFPLHLSLMAERAFPFSALGLVHISNRIEQLAPIPAGEQIDLTVWAEDLRSHPRGRQFDFRAEAELGGSLAWRETSTYLKRENGDSGSSGDGEAEDPHAGLHETAEWEVPGDIGRRYADVSGDRNPIHLHALLARPFGYPTAIAHGMWTKARCLASFEGRMPESFSVDTEFRSPVRIPGKARLWSGRHGGGWAFRLETPDGEHAHALGSISPGGSASRS